MTSELDAPLQPQRPKRPTVPLIPQPPRPSAEPEAVRESSSGEAISEEASGIRHHPILPPDSPMQFRAIGLVKGCYQPSEEQFTRGSLKTPDGHEIDTVLLGRVMSLVRKYLQLDRDYLWVVYPRTRVANKSLHLQVVGVWAPEEMGQTDATDLAEVKPDVFSIRGEVVRLHPDQGEVSVKIVPNSKKPTKRKSTSFKLQLVGSLPPDSVGMFWDLEVERQAESLAIAKATAIGPAPKPPPKLRRRSGGGPPKKFQPRRQDDRAGYSKEPPPRPVLKHSQSQQRSDSQQS